MAEWEAFTAGKQVPARGSDDWVELNSVRHGTHLMSALRIAEDSKLSAELIYDGRLRTTRTKVVYFSPNTWNSGSRYGPFEFEVNWDSLLQGRHLYWVEPIYSYKLPIHRFLLTRAQGGPNLQTYDPVVDNGPLRLVSGTWLRTAAHVSEIVIDEDLDLSAVHSFRLETHNAYACSLGRTSCEERGPTGKTRAAARLMAALLGRGLRSLNRLLVDRDRLTFDAEIGCIDLYQALSKGKAPWGMLRDDQLATDLVKAAGLLVHGGDREGANRLGRLLDSEGRLERVFLELVRAHFEVPNWTWL